MKLADGDKGHSLFLLWLAFRIRRLLFSILLLWWRPEVIFPDRPGMYS